MIAMLKRWHAWLAEHSAYLYALLAIFPEVWLQSTELQAMLPATLVSRIAPFIAVLGFALRLRRSFKTVRPDESDKAGA